MRRKQIPRDELSSLSVRGDWNTLNTEKGMSARMHCPGCFGELTLTGHSITEKGEVTPSVVCPEESCTYHEFVTLVDWDDPAYEGEQDHE